ncbi:hypothetical protein DL93DRAFT_2075617, partial [Clavulina sp. PMI_390]
MADLQGRPLFVCPFVRHRQSVIVIAITALVVSCFLPASSSVSLDTFPGTSVGPRLIPIASDVLSSAANLPLSVGFGFDQPANWLVIGLIGPPQ